MFSGINPFWLAPVWAVLCVFGAAVLLGNALTPWGVSWWWILVLLVVGLAPMSVLIYWLTQVMKAL